MLSIIVTSLSGFISFALLDYIFLAKIAKDFYLTKLASHIEIKDGSLVPYLPAVPFVYVIAILAIWIFVLRHVHTLHDAALYGALLGFFMYAFYDFTNLATLKGYPWSITIVDSMWGAVIVGVVTTIMFIVKSKM